MITNAPVPEGQGWTPVPHSTARDRALSYKALGLLAELLSYPPGWETNVDKLYAINKREGGRREGRDSMRGAMQELERAGYVTRRREQHPDGTFTTTVTAHNLPVGRDRRTGYQASVNQASVHQSSVSQASLQRLATETVMDTDDGHATALASARAAAANAAARRLEALYADVDAMTPTDRRNLLLKFERKRARIYRDCRNNAIDQFNCEKPQIFSDEWAAEKVDALALKYALQHYQPEGDRTDWPQWILPPKNSRRAA